MTGEPMKNDAADARSDGKTAPANHIAPARSTRRPFKNWKHEKFASFVAAGTAPVDAYTLAGFKPNRANHNKLMKYPHIVDRIAVLRREREMAARAARMPLDQVLGELDSRGIIRIEDLFERNAAGIVAVRNLEIVPVEVGLAFIKALGDAFGIRER